MSTTVYQIDPLRDPRWARFVSSHPRATIFHTPAWLDAVCQTYKYRAFCLTTTPPGCELTNGIAFCEVSSWLTGHRWVSVPFADHCDPLVDREDDLDTLLDWIQWQSSQANNKYVELRPLNTLTTKTAGFSTGSEYRVHLLDVTSTIPDLLKSFDKHSVQRRIPRVEREGLQYDEGRSETLLHKFYELMILTRRRHHVPPQPIAWYRNLLNSAGEKASIRMVSKDGVPVASILTLRHGQSVIYKYGASDRHYNALSGNVLLFWRAIQDARDSGASIFDMGRSDLDNPGLIRFKSNWGTTNLPLTYWRYPALATSHPSALQTMGKLAGPVLSHLPDRCLTAVGSLLYRHAG